MAIRPKVPFAFLRSWICVDETDSLRLPPESPRGRARDSSRFPKICRNIKEVLELTADTIFELDGPVPIDINRDSKRIEFVPRDGWQKKEEKSDPHNAAGHPSSDEVCFLDELKIEKREQDGVCSAVLPDSPSPADNDKLDLCFLQELHVPSIEEHEESGKASDDLLEHGRQNSRSDRKQRRGQHDPKTTRLHSSGRNLVAYFLILSGIAVSAMANPLLCKTTQNFSKYCLSKFRQQDACPGDPTVRKKLNDLCCPSFNQTASYHCREQDNCIIHACVPEVIVGPGKTVELKTDNLGNPRLTIVDCGDGYYENSNRSSPDIISPQCQMQKTTCTNDGEVLLKDGGTTEDNLCDCQPNYRYIGECRQGFSLDSPCSCEACGAGHIRDEENNCVQAGLTSTPGDVTRQSPGNVTEPTRGDVSVDPKMKDKRPEERKGSSFMFRIVPEGIIISYIVAGVVFYIAFCRFEWRRNMIRLASGLNTKL